jgi:hypothetical protein
MKLRVSLLQIRYGEAEVTLGGRQGAVPQQVLYVAQAGVVLDEVRSAGVPPHMRRHELPDLGRLGMAFDQEPERMPVQWMAPVGDEQPICLAATQQLRAAVVQVVFQRADGHLPEGYHPILGALAQRRRISS